ncbi:unnamed protein product [Protopolystoma xenopodis]|uniref:Uncharacterized protein n=1 Tax=Protopolystoma xenopodis TaxID=117903 RepID=A0A3S5B0Q6_9PLAT|nr:unnamed protein product [Protopolystoma xenopodis]
MTELRPAGWRAGVDFCTYLRLATGQPKYTVSAQKLCDSTYFQPVTALTEPTALRHQLTALGPLIRPPCASGLL